MTDTSKPCDLAKPLGDPATVVTGVASLRAVGEQFRQLGSQVGQAQSLLGQARGVAIDAVNGRFVDLVAQVARFAFVTEQIAEALVPYHTALDQGRRDASNAIARDVLAHEDIACSKNVADASGAAMVSSVGMDPMAAIDHRRAQEALSAARSDEAAARRDWRIATRWVEDVAGITASVLAAGRTGWSTAPIRSLAHASDIVAPRGIAAAQVNQWWAALSLQDRLLAEAAYGEELRNLDGIPFAVRDRLNRQVLPGLIEKAQAEFTEADGILAETNRILTVEQRDLTQEEGERAHSAQGRQLEAKDRLSALLNVQKALSDNGEHSRLLALDVSGRHAKAAIGFGDVDRATNIGVFVPGMGSRVEKRGQFKRYVDEMANMRSKAYGLLREKEPKATFEQVATVTWLGYDAPRGIIEAAKKGHARKGGVELAGFSDALEANNPDSRKSVIAHSYGSLTASFASRRTSSFDAFIALGSPGVDPDEGLGDNDLEELLIPEGELYAATAWGDYVSTLGNVHGPDPAAQKGFVHLETAASGEYEGIWWHSGYLKEETTSQHNVAAVVSGNTKQIIEAGE